MEQTPSPYARESDSDVADPSAERADRSPVWAELSSRAAVLAPNFGVTSTSLPGVNIVRWGVESPPTALLYTPRICVGLEGLKEVVCGDRRSLCGPGDELVVSVALPVTGRIVGAPYSAVTIDLDLLELTELASALPSSDDDELAVFAGPASAGLAEATLRALRMLDDPREATLLGETARREIAYRVLVGARGATLRDIAARRGHVAHVASALAHLRTHYAAPLDIEGLARRAGMSTTSFHRHFRAVTSMSPLQYVKQLRLQEARRLLVSEGLDVTAAAARVGYESPTQFTREYARLFGAPPRRDATRLRQGSVNAPTSSTKR